MWPSRCHTELSQARADRWKIDRTQAYCVRCGVSMGPGGVTSRGCACCVGLAIPWDRIVRLNAYTEPVDSWIASMKFGGAWPWATWFGRALAEVIGQTDQHHQNVAVCPVPMHWARRIRRGYNQAHLMGAALARCNRWPIVPLLRRTRYTAPQITVAPWRRKANIRRSFSVRPLDLSGWHIWIVDDVKTTGSTLSACARLLRRAGALSVNAAVAAVADPRSIDQAARTLCKS